MEKKTKAAPVAPKPRILNARDARKYLGVHEVTFAALVERGSITPIEDAEGTLVGYDKDALKRLR